MQTLSQIFAHNRWATEVLIESCRGLTDEQLATAVEGTYGGLGETLAHLVSGDRFYVELLTGSAPEWTWRRGRAYPGVDTLLSVARATGDALIKAVETIPADRLVERDPGEMIPAWVILVQAINHANDHRSHASTILTQLGITPPAIDGWAFAGFE